jgi:outer membrane protein OmpA-like peptidoglycan-associated protein
MRFIVIILLLPLSLSAQNLLLNGGFEEENICSEYQVNCAPEAWIYTVPSFVYYFRNAHIAHTGVHFVALIAGNSNKPYYRTFVRSRLLCGLRKGNKYRLSLYVRSQHSILDSIGVFFSSYDFLFEKTPYQQIKPSLYLADANPKINKKDTGWQHVQIDYTATGDEAFISIGNFQKGDLNYSTGLKFEKNFFIYLDDLSLLPLSPAEGLCPDWQKRKQDIYNEDERHYMLKRLILEHKDAPLEPETPPRTTIQKIDTLVVPDVLFQTAKTDLEGRAIRMLDSVVQILRTKIIDSIIIEGHTDNMGNYQANKVLAEGRALAVTYYLEPRVYRTIIISRGWASDRPVADNRTVEGRQLNRRVEIYLYVRE